jgi:hypothetical protein
MDTILAKILILPLASGSMGDRGIIIDPDESVRAGTTFR